MAKTIKPIKSTKPDPVFACLLDEKEMFMIDNLFFERLTKLENLRKNLYNEFFVSEAAKEVEKVIYLTRDLRFKFRSFRDDPVKDRVTKVRAWLKNIKGV